MSIIAGLYAGLVIFLAPISFGPVQLRVADALIPLAALFGWPVILGVGIGCLIGNAYYFLGPVDVLLGPLANIVSAYIIFSLRRRPLLACVVGALPIGVVVGGYLWLFFPPPSIFELSLPVWAAMMLSITLSSLIATAGLGYMLLKALTRKEVLEPLRQRGLRTHLN
jgi:hypothetical protein